MAEPAVVEPSPEDWLTRKEAAVYAKRSVDTIDRAIKTGRLKATKTDGRVAIRRRWIDAYLLLVLILTTLLSVLLLVNLGLGFVS
jgi:excisionase family DNA binding protein